MIFKSYIDPDENKSANEQLPKLMVEGLLLGGSGLGVLALIFEIAADAFSVAAYQTLLAIHGASGHHEIAMYAFIVLSILLFLGIVPAYKAGAYLRPNAGGSGPLVEAIGPPRMRWLSWVGTSLFFLDAVLTIIISSISAADVSMLIYPEFAEYRMILAEVYAFFIMVVLVALGPKRAVPLFLIGGGAFTIFTLGALSLVGTAAIGNPDWVFLGDQIVAKLQSQGVVEHVERAMSDMPALGTVLFFQLFFRSMSSAMLGFSGYEVIPASGKHAAKPKWKVINTALTLAAVFLISTGVVQLFAASQWRIPATEGYSTLLIEYEMIASQTLGAGIEPDDIIITPPDEAQALRNYNNLTPERLHELEEGLLGEDFVASATEAQLEEATLAALAEVAAFSRVQNEAMGSVGTNFLLIAGVLLAIILLLAQGGGYIGGAAVAANAAQLGRLPSFFQDDRIGIAVIWAVAAILIPIIREVVIVEAYYAFGFVTAFMITSTTVVFVRDDVLEDRGIKVGSDEAKSLKFAGIRGMIASYFMGAVLIFTKTDALLAIVVAGVAITLLQWLIANGGFRAKSRKPIFDGTSSLELRPVYADGITRAHDEARQRAIADAIHDMYEEGAFVKFNVDIDRIVQITSHIFKVDISHFNLGFGHAHHDRHEEPSVELEQTYQNTYNMRQYLFDRIEHYSHYGIFTFIEKYHANWINAKGGRDSATVQQAMLDILFPMTPHDEVWNEYRNFEWEKLPEEIWQFSRERYRWAKDQWPNLSDRITTVWTLQDFGLIPEEVDIEMVISVSSENKLRRVGIHTHGPEDNVDPDELDHNYEIIDDEEIEHPHDNDDSVDIE
ncbi:MAG: hypothetical protein WBC91_15765 [Phototrophicaceae bacterium]